MKKSQQFSNSRDAYFEFKRNLRYQTPIDTRVTKIKRNERCPCNSGDKFKNCCLAREKQKQILIALREKDRAEEERRLKAEGIITL